jgi:probable rRNA maturation factor
MSKVLFFNADISIVIRNKRFIKKIIKGAFLREQHKLEELTYIFCSDDYLLRINQNYLNHDTLTDVITFPFSNKNEPVKAEVYISIDRVKENSQKYESTFESELLRVIIHGALHLCGYKDKKSDEKKVMKIKEDFYLKSYYISKST